MLDTPLSLITDILLPNVRGLVAKRLRAQGMSQNKIALLVGVTQPAIKQYLDEDEDDLRGKLGEAGLSNDEVESLVSNLVSLVSSGRREEASLYFTTFGLTMLSQLKLCNFHRRMNTSISPDCRICQSLYREDEETELQLALSLLRNESVAKLIPEILSNLAYSKRDAKEILDVLAIPGRIAVIGGVPTPASRPTWGGSRHLATILLETRKRCQRWRSVMNIKYDDGVDEAIRSSGLINIKVGPSDRRDDQSIANMIAAVISSCPDVVIHLGGNGVEPNAYVFGENPLEVSSKVLKIAKLCCEPS
ncbi:Bifunctional thiamine biosynthesis protein ThiDN [Metallosphaera sp. J1]|uniref:thiamine-phosphate synthase family protein n=1 Tax=Metallosphaera javensis (ex Hofmann et al. 2022) TaxID=99938 RepID=UPI001EDF78C5|nr:thiamine-phosphate synthase family protein [Metallosphaera javensis (ex Hofmann et al. 2022)]MCG3107976.1 Bifunctional thiamine biosynthesis protein ThiDN [Metallosphaera javensis (ex Hofmann et al. 2022)]